MSKTFFVICSVLALVVGALVVSAQQKFEATNVADDPCAYPDRVITTGLFTGSAMQRDQLVAIDGSERIYLCSVWFIGSAVGDVSIYFGTGTTCGTGEDLLSRQTLTADLEPIEFVSGGVSATASRSDTGHAFCIERHAAMILTGHYRYVQE